MNTFGVWTQMDGYQTIEGLDVYVTLEPRPQYCDRGNFIAKVFPKGNTFEQIMRCHIDAQDAWPRYYFDEARAKDEVWAWLKKRGQV